MTQYPFIHIEFDEPENSLYDISEFEAAVQGHDKSHPWINEWGYSEAWLAKDDFGRSRHRMANMIARLMLTAAIARAKIALVYDLIDDGTDPHDAEFELRPL